jgi:hypothetical protein
MTHEHSPHTGPWFRSRSGLVLLAFLAIAGFFVITEHTAHLFGFLPYLLLLACPLLHLFHRGHGGGHGDHGGERGSDGKGGAR